MKKIFFILLILSVFTQCSDYLEEDNLSQIAADEYYRTKDGYESLVNSAYSTLRTVYREPWVFMAGTDMYVEGRNTQPEGLSEYQNLTSSDPFVKNFYSNCYSAIRTCNIAIDYNDKTEAVTTLGARLGEMKFLRAYYYFLLVQTFGGVAIIDQTFDSPVLSFSRNSASEVYDFIIKEMNEAFNLLPETTAQFGRASRRAILHYLAKVHLTRGYESFAASDDFTQAASYADQAINSYNLSQISFEDLFWPGKEKNNEVLFSLQYAKVSMKDVATDGSNQNYWFGPYWGGEGNAQGYPNRSYTLCPTMYTFNLFTEHDARWEGTFMTTVYQRYYDYYDKPKTDRPILVVNRYFPHTWEVDDIADWEASHTLQQGSGSLKGTIIPYSEDWEAKAGIVDRATPPVRKFDDPTSVFSSAGSSARDIYLARLGETYLIAAEAYFKLNDLGTAADRINQVRTRAAKPGQVNEMLITSDDVTIDFILDERGRELVGEYHRWFDLKRTGMLVERNNLHHRPVREKYFKNGINAFIGPDGNLKILRPIPQDALDLNQNKNFGQNPGY